MKSIIELLVKTAQEHPDKVGFTDENRQVTFAQMRDTSYNIAAGIHQMLGKDAQKNRPIAVFLDRSVACIEAMFGVLSAGDFYVVIDVKSPANRIEHIINTLAPIAVITEEAHLDAAKTIAGDAEVLMYEKLSAVARTDEDDECLAAVHHNMIDTDPAYVLFTSGSSGVPKGAVVSHKAVLSYIEWATTTFKFDENTAFGSQTPLYFSMSVTDLYSTVKSGATYHIIPKQLFTFPLKLIEYMNEHEVNTIYWVPSAMGIVADWDTFSYAKPEHLKTVLFAGEVMPVKHLNYWRRFLPECKYANLFGPTETTDICTFYVVDRELEDTESLPIGVHCDNCDVVVITQDGREAEFGEEGELVVRGSFLADGYYNNPEKTASAFPQNPLNKCYPERVYRTGDIVKYNERGELIYINRKDFQVKRSGYRIELGEIEAAAILVEGVKKAAVLYDHGKEEIVAFYEGKPKDTAEFLKLLHARVPAYMMPDKAIRLRNMPYNANGKIDREALKQEYIVNK